MELKQGEAYTFFIALLYISLVVWCVMRYNKCIFYKGDIYYYTDDSCLSLRKDNKNPLISVLGEGTEIRGRISMILILILSKVCVNRR